MARVPQSLVDEAVALAHRWVATSGPAGGEGQASARETRTTRRLAALVADPRGLDLAIRFVDLVARPEDHRAAARELARLGPLAGSAAGFLGPLDRGMLALGARLAPALPDVVVPLATARLHQLVGHLVADAGTGLACHVAGLQRAGFRANINLLGEAVLGEAEAADRARRLRALVERPDVDYVSVKASAVVSQLSAWDTADAVHRVTATLRPLFLSAARHGTFLTLDMEEYRDLAVTLAVFVQLLAEPELARAPVGIALQAYLPDSSAALETVQRAAERRRAAGGTAVKVRLVKGANLAMERVDAELHGWAQAPFGSKAEVDAHYVRLLELALTPARTDAVRLGLASHNLFDVALGHLLARERGVSGALDVEMLQGMAPAQARAVRDTVGPLVLYTPVVAAHDLDVAVSYLVRRLDENAAGENFLHALFADDGGAGAGADEAGGGGGLHAQELAFRTSVDDADHLDLRPRRAPRSGPSTTGPSPAVGQPGFVNAPDTDPALAPERAWALRLVSARTAQRLRAQPVQARVLHDAGDVDDVLARAAALQPGWAQTTPARRAQVLRTASTLLERARGDLVATMVHEAHKTVGEADPEVSEAVDFAAYYAEQALELDRVPGATFAPSGITLVTPPWNFPVAIPLGSTLAALAAGSPVVLKPSHLTPRCAETGAAAVRAALVEHGFSPDVLQVVRADEDTVGRALLTHPRVTRVVLTGSLETAQTFARWRPDLDVLAETSGKNAVVVTASADVDLAVADVVRSAFGHAGQKCSAASLLVLVGAAGRSRRLRRQLADAVTSLAVGPATALATTVGPLTDAPSPRLLRALTTLDPGERWLVRPRRLAGAGAGELWTPGVRSGVAPGSFFHLTEVFGPVLGVVHVETLDEAIAVQNAVAFGLTGGLHSLDEDEIVRWVDQVEVGNAYVNRTVTGAIVGRQPFGGWKASVVGPGAKAGGPGYLPQLGTWHDDAHVPDRTDSPQGWLTWALADDARAWAQRYGVAHDLAGLAAESNVLRYRPLPRVTLRVGAGARGVEVERVLGAARRAGVPVVRSDVADVDDATFAGLVAAGEVTGRIRVLGHAPGLRAAAAARTGTVTVLDQPVLASGERELATMLREQVVSRTVHRFGHLAQAERRTVRNS